MVPTYTLRRATPADAALLSDLASRTFVETFGHVHATNDLHTFLAATYSTAQMRRELQDARRHTIVAFASDPTMRPCGYVMLHDKQIRPGDESRPSDQYMELQRFYVDSAFHGKGVAQQLMTHALQVIHHKNRPIVWLGVWGPNGRARRFYEKYGFKETGV